MNPPPNISPAPPADQVPTTPQQQQQQQQQPPQQQQQQQQPPTQQKPQQRFPQPQQQPQPPQIQPKTQPAQPFTIAAHANLGHQTVVQPITSVSNTTGPTALVIIPQHANTVPPGNVTTTAVKGAVNSITSVSTVPPATPKAIPAAHVTLTRTTQSSPLQLTSTTIATTHLTNIAPLTLPDHQHINVQPTIANRPPPTVPNIPSIPMTDNQHTTVQSTIVANRPPSSLPVISMNNIPIKSEPNKYICCLLDNGVRCGRVAGNASFSARIQKIVGNKKMNFTLDPEVRHAYICEHHKAIITVAKKSTTIARESKANAKNYAAHNNANTIVTQNISNFNDLSRQQPLQHPLNLEVINNQNRLATNHAGTLNNMPTRPGQQIAYGHYQGSHPNQVGGGAPLDLMMTSNFDNAGGDNLPSSSGGVDVDLQQLQVNTLRRYKRHFRVQTRPGLNKLQLAESLKSHFRTLPIIEKEAITYFVYIVKCYRNKLDHNPKAD